MKFNNVSKVPDCCSLCQRRSIAGEGYAEEGEVTKDVARCADESHPAAPLSSPVLTTAGKVTFQGGSEMKALTETSLVMTQMRFVSPFWKGALPVVSPSTQQEELLGKTLRGERFQAPGGSGNELKSGKVGKHPTRPQIISSGKKIPFLPSCA